MLKIAINGIMGRMGQELVRQINAYPDFELVGGIDRQKPEEKYPYPVETNPETVVALADVVIDFSLPAGAIAVLKACRNSGKKLVTGTTGFSDEEMKFFREAAREIAIVQAFNFSIGINLLAVALEMVSGVVGRKSDIEITEVHHRHKKDAPSGTALLLAGAVWQGMGATNDEAPLVFGREGRNLARGSEIAVHSLRGGSVVGEHTVHFLGENESLTFTHKAQNRGLFADGALMAARWVAEQTPGLYGMSEVLGLNLK
ncbi:MAG: 4-hydroxy-tetrahydrodipicolinate reductase [Calditrichia bacterium]